MLEKVVVLAIPGVAPFEFGVICEVFGIDRSDTGGPTFEFAVATAEPGPRRDEPRASTWSSTRTSRSRPTPT